MNAKNIRSAIIAGGLLAGTVAAQGSHGILFTVRQMQTSGQCAVNGAINEVLDHDIQYFVPQTGAVSSVAYGPQVGYAQMIGDHDCDGDYWESDLFGRNDALLRPRDSLGNPIAPASTRGVFFSPSQPVRHSGLGWAFNPGDVGRILRNGTLERFISGGQVKKALGIPANEPINVDAAAMSYELARSGLYLSFEDAEFIDTITDGPTLVADGAVLYIPLNDILPATSPFDGASIVSDVAQRRGQLWLTEAQMTVRVLAADVGDCAGNRVLTIGDTDGLAVDPAGELMFTGSNLDGGAVLTTRNGGEIAQLNGRPLARRAPNATSGKQVGLVTCPGSLAGLSLVEDDLCHFTTDTQTTSCGGGCVARIEWGGALNTVGFLLVNALPDDCTAGPDASVGYTANPVCFPDYYPAAIAIPVLTNPDGCGSWTSSLPSIPDWHVTVQMVEAFNGDLRLSTPTVIDL